MGRADQPLARFIERDHGLCGLCGLQVSEEDATRDHVIPLSLGGAMSRHNLRLAHRACNQARADTFPSGPFRGISAELQAEAWNRDRGRCHRCKTAGQLLFHRGPGSSPRSATPQTVKVLCTDCARSARARRNRRHNDNQRRNRESRTLQA